jgi:FMN phosphatase YigB (HAD superfamily)
VTGKTTLITDFDNTLYDWFGMWHQSFTAMLREIVRISGISEEVLLPEIRKIHQEFGTSEYAFLVGKMPSLLAKYPSQDISLLFDDAIHAYRSARKANLKLYDGVRETLAELQLANVLIVLYTDSRAFYTIDRILRLELDQFVDFAFSPPVAISHTQKRSIAM